MKTIVALTVVLLLVSGCALAEWDTANGRGLIPYWQTGGYWYTLLSFVNTSEETSDVIPVRFFPIHGSPCSDTGIDMYSIRAGEMLMFSTTPSVPHWIPTSADYGIIKFRTVGGGFIHACCVIYNQVTGSGYIVPAYHQDRGF